MSHVLLHSLNIWVFSKCDGKVLLSRMLISLQGAFDLLCMLRPIHANIACQPLCL